MLVVLPSFILSGCSVFGVSSTKEAKYQTVYKDKVFSVRNYEPVMIAEVTLPGKTYAQVSGKAFSMLFQYISGKNSTQGEIAMTTPVVSQQTSSSEKISMTTPVLVDSKTKDAWTMAFVLPEKYTPKNTPKPLNSEVKIFERPEMKVAVIQFSGTLTPDSKAKNMDKLRTWAKSKNYVLTGKAIYASYDPPWTLPKFRRNEVQIKIK